MLLSRRLPDTVRLRGDGPNTIVTGPGDDIVEAYAQGRAAVDCGPGSDRVNIGFNRLVRTRHCETVKHLYKKRHEVEPLQRASSLGRAATGRRRCWQGRTQTERTRFMRLPIAALAAFVLSLALAAPASAKQPLPDPADFSYIATIDCGRGPVQVGSTDEIYAPLVDLATGRKYEPVAWDVSFEDFHFVDSKYGVTKRNPVDCSYVDEWVSGTVTVKRTLPRRPR